MGRYASALARDEVPFEPFLLVGQMTTADPSRSPAGTESLWSYTHLPRRAGRERGPGGARPRPPTAPSTLAIKEKGDVS